MSGEARAALFRLGVGEHQLKAVAASKPVAFYLSDAAEGTTAVLLLTAEGRLRVGIYTVQNKEGSGLQDFLIFDIRARAVAKAMAVREIELMGIEMTNSRLEAALVLGGFTPTTMPVPEELGGGTFNAISRVEPME